FEICIAFAMHKCYIFSVIKMAEFCVDCRNKLNGTDVPRGEYVLSKELELCEGCGQMKNVVLAERAPMFFRGQFEKIRRRQL
ncbi:MAG: hypothetical protein IJP23_06195, partial [Oscillospiraceae bacterium]|nr:hypothetical protein [Oscillospiraceae bacterium]